MNRTEIEIKLNRDRAWLLEAFSALSEDDLNRGITRSRHDPGALWSAKDHLSHLIGIEIAFNRIIRRHIEGHPNPIEIGVAPDGSRRSMEEVMAIVHEMNDQWVDRHKTATLSEIVAIGQKVRADTLALLASLTDEQLEQKIPGAPWGDATVGGVMAVNGDHARRHYGWVSDGLAGKKI